MPILAGLIVVNLAGGRIVEHFASSTDIAALVAVRERDTLSLGMLGAILALHAMGLIDDKRSLARFPSC